MRPLYHLMPRSMEGCHLHPLNMLKDRFPDTFAQHRKKYAGREELMERRLPMLNCLWNDVLHLSPVHPGLIRDALRNAGLPGLRRGREFAVIDPDRLGMTKDNTVIWHNIETAKAANLRSTPEGFTTFSPDKLDPLGSVPDGTIRYFEEAKREGEAALLFVGIPHVLFRGSIDLEMVEIEQI